MMFHPTSMSVGEFAQPGTMVRQLDTVRGRTRHAVSRLLHAKPQTELRCVGVMLAAAAAAAVVCVRQGH